MATSTPRSARQVKRHIGVIDPIREDGAGRIHITTQTGTKVLRTEYDVQTFPAYDGAYTGVALTKDDGTVYHVCLSGRDATCDCIGAQRWHQHPCKHLAGLNALQRAGKLPLPIIEAAQEVA